MQFDQMIIEVDGTLANPVVGMAVVIWSLLLSAGAVRLVAQYRRVPASGGPQAGRRAGILVRMAFLFVVTPIAQSSLGSLIYQVDSFISGRPGFTSVGFWGGPPVLPAWIVALVCIWATLRRDDRLSQGAGDATP